MFITDWARYAQKIFYTELYESEKEGLHSLYILLSMVDFTHKN